jgi:serine/threonine-protein kinase
MRADLLRAAAGRPVSAPPVMTEADRTAMLASPQRPAGQPMRPVARVADRNRQRSGATAIVVLITVLGVLAFGALGLGLFLANQSPDSTTVPSLAGKTNIEAEQLIREAKLKGTKSDVKVPACQSTQLGKVVQQSPAPNTQVDEGSDVTYQVCLDADKASVPPLVGLTQQQAEQALAERNLKAKPVQISHTDKAGLVVSAVPAPGQEVTINTVVTINISKGDQALVPDVTTKDEQGARLALERAGFSSVTVRTQDTANANEVGKVIRQTPAANQPHGKSQAVTIFIGKQTQPTQSPSPSVTTTPPATP